MTAVSLKRAATLMINYFRVSCSSLITHASQPTGEIFFKGRERERKREGGRERERGRDREKERENKTEIDRQRQREVRWASKLENRRGCSG